MSEVYTVTMLHDNLYQIDEGGVRCFLCVGENRAMLVDSGYGKGDLKSFVQTLTDKPVFLVNTHADGDHTGCNEMFGAAHMHPSEFDYYRSKKPNDTTKLLPLWEGDVIDLGTMKFEVVLIPGHTPGSIALLDRANRRLIGGDSIQKGPIFMFGPGRNLPAYICSMKKLLAMSGAFDQVIPSHNRMDVDAAVLPSLIAGAEKLLAGELEGVNPGRPLPCKLYNYEESGFLY